MRTFIISLLLCCTFLSVQAQKYKSYKGLVMAGYQGWFAAEGDESNRGWYHYGGRGFRPGGTISIDFWPDMTEYTKKYVTPFKLKDGSDAYLYSAYDEESVDLHFKWMKEYGIDGVFMQRFVGEAKSPAGKRHFNKVLASALKAAKKYDRAICVMYDLSGSGPNDMDFILEDWKELQSLFSLKDTKINPTYLHHNGSPVLTLWGVGFNDGRRYSIANVDYVVTKLKEGGNISIMLGVPYYWSEFGNDTEKSPALHELIKKADIVMPWAVGRYNSDTYAGIAAKTLPADIAWCKANKVDYVPLVFPGFSWGNLKKNPNIFNQIPRDKGKFLWKQIAGAKAAGAEMLYVAMFDEVDEGTAIFKCALEKNVPLNGDLRFVGIDDDLKSDHYLWLVGEAGKWVRGGTGYSSTIPVRK